MEREGDLEEYGNIWSGHSQTSGDERENKKRLAPEDEKTTWNPTMKQKSHQRDKYLDRPLL